MPIRALVVEDSSTVRAHLRDVLDADPDIEVVGQAADGKRAIELCLALRPDVITMDMMLPVMSGLAATEYVMAHCPTPILVVSSSWNRGELFKTYDALAAGAVDVLEKPTGLEDEGVWERRFISTVKLVSRIKVITHPRGRFAPSSPRPMSAPNTGPARKPGARFDAVAIGVSTGGPSALLELVRALPPTFQLPILLVLHIGEPFGTAFAEWLDAQTSRPVALARDGDVVAAARGRVLMAPPDQHLVVEKGRLRLHLGPERHSCRPSVDVLFESVAHDLGEHAIGCLLTGMGRDGATGLAAIRAAGGATIAQDEATSVVYGMPGEAVRLGAAQQVLPLHQIAQTLCTLAKQNDAAGATS